MPIKLDKPKRKRPKEYKGIPGSVYTDKGKLVVKLNGQKIHTRLDDTPTNYNLALEILKNMFLQSLGITAETQNRSIFIQDAFKQFMETKKDKSSQMRTTLSVAFRMIFGEENVILSKQNVLNRIERYLSNTNISNVSINTYLRHIQVFLNYCYEHNWIEKMHVKKSYGKQARYNEPKTFTTDEIKLLLNHFRKHNYKLYVLIRLQVLTGMRVGECLNLEKSQIKDNSIFLGNKTRYYAEKVQISEDFQDELLRLNGGLKVFHWSPSSYSRLLRMFKDGMQRCNIPDDRGFHSLRKTFRTLLKNQNLQLEDVQVMMRHSTINLTTDVYTKFDKNIFSETFSVLSEEYK